MDVEFEYSPTIRVINSFATDESEVSNCLSIIRDMTKNSHDVEMKDGHIPVESPRTIIDALAVYW